MMKNFVSILLLLLTAGCAGTNISRYCDVAQKAYLTATAAAKAAHEQGLISEDVWANCVKPADAAANEAVIACYRAAVAADPVELISSLATSAGILISELRDLRCP